MSEALGKGNGQKSLEPAAFTVRFGKGVLAFLLICMGGNNDEQVIHKEYYSDISRPAGWLRHFRAATSHGGG